MTERLGVALSSKLRENRLKCFRHVKRKTADAPVRMVESLIVEGKRSRDRPKRIWSEQFKIDMGELHLSKNMTNDRSS